MEVEHVDVLEIVNRVLGKDYKNKSFIETIEGLLALVERQQKEYNSLFCSISEDDAIISSLQEEIIGLKKTLELKEVAVSGWAKQYDDLQLAYEFAKASYMDLDD